MAGWRLAAAMSAERSAAARPEPRPAEVVCLGETMAMVAPARAEPLESAEEFLVRPAGAESNVAMYLAALGHRAAWAGRLGADPLGRRVLRQIGTAGVDTSLAELDPAAPTGVYFKDPGPDGTRVFYYRRGSAQTRMKPEVLALVAAREPAVVHVTGITPALSPQCDDLIGRVTGKPRSGSALVSFDVNFRPAVWAERPAAPRLLELAQGADIVFVGLDEAGELWGTSKPADVRRLIGNPRVLVVKDGAAGATAFHAGGAEHVPAPEVSVVEPVGAGDAFAAGWLSGLLRGRTQRDRLRLGHLIASAALASTADCAPLPGSGWLEAALAASEDSWRTVLSAGRALG